MAEQLQQATPDEAVWFYRDNEGKQLGPESATLVQQLLKAGQLSIDTIVWKDGLPNWVPLKEVEELSIEAKPSVKAKATGAKAKATVGTPAPANAPAPELAELPKSEPGGVWFYSDKYRERVGPVTENTLMQLYARCDVNDVTLVWKAGMGSEWQRVCEVDELANMVVEAEKIMKANSNKPKAAGAGDADKKKKKKKRKPKWKQRKEHANVYVQGLPPDVTMTEMNDHFKKCGVIAMDMATEQPRIKLYKDEAGKLKGDGLVCYAKPASVKLALEYIHESEIRAGFKITVQKAEFKMKGETFVAKKVDKDGNKVKKYKMGQADRLLSWNDGEEEGEGLRIVILKHMFTLEDAKDNEAFYTELTLEIGVECEKKVGAIEKLTVFEGSPVGAVAVKFKEPSAAARCIEVMGGRFFGGEKIECDYWDGETNYKIQDTEDEEAKRLEEFGDWLENADAPVVT